jgi:RimJ/RimL family protein N-acetyltransferase
MAKHHTPYHDPEGALMDQILTSERCTLRPWRPDDAEPLARLANNWHVARNLSDVFPHPYTLETARGWLDQRAQDEPPVLNLAIEVDGVFAGGIGGHPLAGEHRITARIGYWLGQDYWGRGLATEALRLYVPYVFAAFPELNKLEATVFSWNPASCRVLQKAGFREEGRLRRNLIKGGDIADEIVYGLLRAECD